MAKDYSLRPSELLFPNRLNPNFMIFVDNIIWEIGKTYELEIEGKSDEIKGRYESKKFELLMKVLIAIAKRS